MNKAQLLAIWAKNFREAPPSPLRKDLMVPILAYRIQEREYGGRANTTRKKLREIAKSVDPGKQSQGTQLIQDLKNDGLYQIKPYQTPPQTDKIMRLHAQKGTFREWPRPAASQRALAAKV
jgi:hypothetical protein